MYLNARSFLSLIVVRNKLLTSLSHNKKVFCPRDRIQENYSNRNPRIFMKTCWRLNLTNHRLAVLQDLINSKRNGSWQYNWKGWPELSPRKFPPLCSPPEISAPCEIWRWRETVPTRVPNPNASEASYKPEQGRGGSVLPGVENPRGETSGWERP